MTGVNLRFAVAAGVLWAGLAACSPQAAVDRREPRQKPAPSPDVAQSAAPARALRVRQVIDGDTITISGIGTVRLIGVDAPEKTGGYRESEPYGDAATRYLKELIEGRLVTLEYDGDRKDQYNRTLAYVFLEDGTCVNEAIIRAGWAETYRRFEYRRKPDFQKAEREARAARRGIWNR
jgi:micrococcal nuclease